MIDRMLSALRHDLAEHGDQVRMFVPYIPLVMMAIGNQCIPPRYVKWGAGYALEAEVKRAEQENAKPQRLVRTSDMIRTLVAFDRCLRNV